MTAAVLTRPVVSAAPVAPVAQSARWARPALAALLLGTAVLYLWGLGASGWANAYYAAAAQAGSVSWKALFFGSFDGANAITVDKAPAAIWVMGLSVRLFGLNAWSILVPEAVMGVASVGVLYAAVRRWFGPAAGLLAGAVLALTPVAVLMFRFNNPDALLVLLLVSGAYAVVRALERGSTRWLVLAGVFVGFGFLAKMLQAFLVLPAFAGVYLFAAPVPVRRRLGQLVLAGLALVASAGWWVATVALWPAASRPYIGGSQHNSILELTLGYNGLGRLTGTETGSVGGGPGGWGRTGWTRLFGAEIGGQVAWLLPAALILCGVLLWFSWRAPRTHRGRAAVLLWGGWLLGTGITFSLMQGIFHAYYTVALAPAIGALVGIGAVLLWRLRDRSWARLTLTATVAVTAVLAHVLLARTASWLPWLRVAVLVAGLAAAALLVVVGRLPRAVALGAAGAALVAVLAGPVAYSVTTATTVHSGAVPSAGPAVAGVGFGGPGRALAGGAGFGGGPGLAGAPGAIGGGSRAGGMGGLLGASTPSTDLVTLLKQNSAAHTWVAATVGANNAAGYQLATGDPVLALGGFNGTDPSPTLAQFQALVAQGKVHYFIGGAGPGGGLGGPGTGGSDAAQQIAAWVAANYAATTVGGVTVYDLSAS